jgi:hypothetical protein
MRKSCPNLQMLGRQGLRCRIQGRVGLPGVDLTQVPKTRLPILRRMSGEHESDDRCDAVGTGDSCLMEMQRCSEQQSAGHRDKLALAWQARQALQPAARHASGTPTVGWCTGDGGRMLRRSVQLRKTSSQLPPAPQLPLPHPAATRALSDSRAARPRAAPSSSQPLPNALALQGFDEVHALLNSKTTDELLASNSQHCKGKLHTCVPGPVRATLRGLPFRAHGGIS